MKVQRARFTATYYEGGRPKYRRGEDYPVTDEVRSRVLAGDAVLVHVRVGAFGLLFHLIESFMAERRLRTARAASIDAERKQ